MCLGGYNYTKDRNLRGKVWRRYPGGKTWSARRIQFRNWMRNGFNWDWFQLSDIGQADPSKSASAESGASSSRFDIPQMGS